MQTFLIERHIPGADRLTADELRVIAAKSCNVIAALGVPYRWVTSYVADDKIYCIHEAEDAETIRRLASEGGFPANQVTKAAAIIAPETAGA